MTEELSIAFRPGVGADLKYIKNSWLESFRDGDGVRGVPNSFYYAYEQKIMKKTLPRCSNSGGVIIAHEHFPEDDFVATVERPILGWICAEALTTGLVVHFVYTRGFEQKGKKYGGAYRNRGIARSLLDEVQRKQGCEGMPIFYTHRTEVCWRTPKARELHKDLNATYVPYYKYSLLPTDWQGTDG